jgi:hypothetical protein
MCKNVGESQEIVSMRLPHAEAAIVDIRKIREYCLSTEHPRGKHKARIFAAALGMTAKDAETLAGLLRRAVRENEAIQGLSDEFGDRYNVDFQLEWNRKTATIRSCWIVFGREPAPRFVTCFVL